MVGRVRLGMDGDDEVLVVLLVDEPRNAKHSHRIGRCVVTIELSSESVQQRLGLCLRDALYFPDHLVFVG